MVLTIPKLLEHQGYAVLEARDAATALKIFEEHEAKIDLVLTDVMMPEMNGRELVELLRARRPALRVLCMSGYTEKAITADGALPPNTGFLEKPFTVDGLTRQVRELLDGDTAER